MRFIEKGPEPPALAAWTSQANEDWRPVYEDLTGADKRAILAALASEQGRLCGYCGSVIGTTESDAHIEHVVSQEECKRTGQRHLLTDYGNMLGSCMGTDDRSRVPKHCGAARGTKPVPVTPYQRDCGAAFVFRRDGAVDASRDPAKREGAEETIRSLALHIPKLKAARAAAIDGALDGLTALSPEAWRAEADRYDAPDGAGRLSPFCFAIRQVLLRHA
jgi:uncharacterized protein (TIGR02646 family)